MIKSYRDLTVWQDSLKLAIAVYRATNSFPKHELYGLVSQLRRCSVSVPSNIAEGHARTSTKDYLRHVSIALGSLAELETQLILSTELTYLGSSSLRELLTTCDVLGRQLRSLQHSLSKRLENGPK